MKEFVIAILIVFVLNIIALYPIAVIYSMNTIFNLSIPFTLKTWMCTFLLLSIFGIKFNFNTKR
jgi:hypothetical protein